MDTITDHNWLLSVGTFLPLAGVLVMLFIPQGRGAAAQDGRPSSPPPATLGVGIYTLTSSTTTRPAKLQFYVNDEWIEVIHANYTIGLDGISLPLYLLSMAHHPRW